jgi:hypothetical protein
LRGSAAAGDSPASGKDFEAMTPPSGAAGFHSHGVPVASTRLIDAVAASLAFAALSVCVVTACTLLVAIKAGIA